MDAASTMVTVGNHAPDFAVLDSTGISRSLTDLVAAEPRVFVFYRGHW
jgi:peroxiredoxin